LKPYLPAPFAGGTPVATLTAPQYTGTVTWTKTSGGAALSGNFAANTLYTATVKLTAASGYVFDVPFTGGSFTYSGATVTDPTNPAGIGIAFPATGSVPVQTVTDMNLTLWVPVPVAGGVPGADFAATQYRSALVKWMDSDGNEVTGNFAGGTDYKAEVTLTPASGYTFDGVAGPFIHTGASAVPTHEAGTGAETGTVKVTILFPATGFTTVFSGYTLVVGDSVIDAIRAAKEDPLSKVEVKWYGGTEEVDLNANRDISANGLILETTNSPAEVILDGGGKTIIAWMATSTIPLITVRSGVTLTLKNITFRGTQSSSNRAPLIKVESGGTLIMKSGAWLTGNINAQSSGFIGGAVYVGGTFIMEDGIISGNSGNRGGGVYVDANGTFRMEYGTISDNTGTVLGGGVYIGQASSQFIMNGGIITRNKATGGGGGGVYVSAGKFDKTGGGTIYGARKEDDSDVEDADKANTATGTGPAVYAPPSQVRIRTAGETVDLHYPLIGTSPPDDNWGI
jgi:hypothetical protein